MNLEKYIQELLHWHDCVIIPSFGGFISSYAPARINKTHHKFYPPSKSLLFNVNLQKNDGLLANHISIQEGVKYEMALYKIAEKVREWQKYLGSHEKLVIGEVGELIKEKEGNIIFVQNTLINFLPESYGLTSLVSTAVKRISDNSVPVIKSKPVIFTYLKWAAMLALPLGITAYLSLNHFEKAKGISANYSGFFFYSSEAKPTVNTINTYVVPAPRRKPNIIEQITVNEQITLNNKYAVIVGAFKFPQNADNFINDLKNKGYNASVYDKTKSGLIRITTGTYSARQEALEQLAAVRTSYSSAWLLAK